MTVKLDLPGAVGHIATAAVILDLYGLVMHSRGSCGDDSERHVELFDLCAVHDYI